MGHKPGLWPSHTPLLFSFFLIPSPRFPRTLAATAIPLQPRSSPASTPRLLVTSSNPSCAPHHCDSPGATLVLKSPSVSAIFSPGLIAPRRSKMYLQYYINEKGDKVYTTKKESPLGVPTQSAHPARFSPDDKYSRQRYLLKKRFGLLPTQQPAPKY